MYRVLCDNALVCDSRIEELALINPVVKLEENKAGSFSFKIPPAHPFYDSIQKRKSIVQVYQDDDLLFSGICIEENKDFYKQKTVKCEGELTFFNDSIQRPAKLQKVTVRGALETYVANHNAQVDESKRFKVGQVTVTSPDLYIDCFTNMESTMKALKKLTDTLGGYIRIRHTNGIRYVDYLADSPNTNEQTIKIGKNLMDFTTNIDSSDIATAIIPLGCKLEESPIDGLEIRLTISDANNGVDYIYNQEAVDAYGWIFKTVEWDSITTASELKAKGEQYLSDIQFEKMVIQAKAVDLHLTNKEVEGFKILDQIRVVSAPHGLNRYFRLTQMTINLNAPEKNTITLGKEERLSISAKSNQANEEIKRAIESIVPPDAMLQQAIENATQLIQNATNGFITTVMNEDGSPRELLVMDTNDIDTATKVWRWNVNGLGYSSTGYNGNYALALTMDGHFVANAITVDGLEVGKNVKMGANATISWDNVTGTPNVATKEQIPTNTNQLENGAGFITAPVATQITKDTVTTTYVNALGVKAKSVDAEDITGELIAGKKFISNKQITDAYEKYTSIDGAQIVLKNSLNARDTTTITNTNIKVGTDSYGTIIESNSISVKESNTLATLKPGYAKIASVYGYSEISGYSVKLYKDSVNACDIDYQKVTFADSGSIAANGSLGVLELKGNTVSLGTAGKQLAFFGTAKKSVQKYVANITTPSAATASDVATKMNDLLNALKAYNLIA